MTHDEIMKMPAGRSLDRLIAERVLRCKVRVSEQTGFIYCDCDPTYPHTDNDVGFVKMYSGNITAAWDVVDKLLYTNDGKENKFMLYRYGFGVTKPRIRWCASWGLGWENLLVYAYAETVPLAICRVALWSVMKFE